MLNIVSYFVSNNDSGVSAYFVFVEFVEGNKLDLPSPSGCKSYAYIPLPYFFIGDEIFPSKTWLMRPFLEKLTEL